MPDPIRVIFQQPALAKYRVPVYREFARRKGIRFKLYYSKIEGLPNVEPDGFEAELVPMPNLHLGRQPIYWHWPQWTCATRKKTDVLLLSWDLHYPLLVPGLLRARREGVGTVLLGHGYSKREARWRAFLRDRAARFGDALLLYNHGTARRYIEAGWDPRRVHVGLNCLDQSPIQAARQHWLDRPGELEAFRRQNRLSPGPVIVFVSRLEPDNRIDWLLEAARLLLPRFPALKVVIVGKGPDGERLRRMAASLGLEQTVCFTGAIYDEMQLAPWFLCSDVFCYPTNIGLSILHAMGYGLPVVTSDLISGQNPEIEALRDGENGALWRHGDISDLATTLGRLLGNLEVSRRMGRSAWETATQRFSLSNMVDGIESAVRYAYSRSRGMRVK